MPLIYNSTDLAKGLAAPNRSITTPAGSTGLQVLNAANVVLNVQTPQGGVPVPPYTVYNIPVVPNQQIDFNVNTVGASDATYVADFVDVQYSDVPGFALAVSALPVTVPQGTSSSIPAIPPGAVAAGAGLLNPAYVPAANGAILLTITLAAGAASSTLQISRNGGSFQSVLNNGTALTAGVEVELTCYVKTGDTVQFSFATATTVGQMEFFYSSQQ